MSQDFSVHGTDRLLVSKEIFIDKDAWYEILRVKTAFLKGNNEFLSSPVVRPEIASSWIYSKEHAVDSQETSLSTIISDDEYHKTIQRNKTLINIAMPVLEIIEQLGLSNDYIFELVDAEGVTLSQTGNLGLHKYVAEQSIFSEATMGTNAHSLCMKLGSSIQLIGPEHYCFVLHDLAATAAPIADENGIVIASLLLTQPVAAVPWSRSYHKTLSHTLGLITSLASVIEHQMRFQHFQTALSKAEDQISLANVVSSRSQHLLESAIGTTKESIIVLSDSGVIQQISPEAGHLLRTTTFEARGKSLLKFIQSSEISDLENALASGERIDTSVTIGHQIYSLKADPISDLTSNKHEGSILKIQKAMQRQLSPAQSKIGDYASISFEDILGSSDTLERATHLAKRFSTTKENILITGESGTGKDYFAQAIHNERFPEAPFMSLNCAAIPPRLIESELFGYEGGSFTGADRNGKPGKIELADGGTLFLDEIGDMPLELQATLLRVLENKRVMRIGGKGYKQVDFQVVSATNKDLASMVKEGAFREDLLYRLSVLTIELPPLRDRGDDLIFFAHYFLNECQRKSSSGPSKFSPETIQLLARYGWPGNLRQLKNAVISSYYASQSDEVTPDALPANLFSNTTITPSSLEPEGRILALEETLSLREIEKQAIIAAFEKSAHNVAKTALLLEVGKATLYRKLKEYGLDQ